MRQYLTGTPFTAWTATMVQGLAGKQVTEDAKRALEFYAGNHWQEGDGWGGPVPDPLTTQPGDATAFMEKVKAAFTSANVVAELVDRHTSAVIGRSPGWQFVPRNAPEGTGEQPDDEGQQGGTPEQPQRDPIVVEIEAAITEWMDQRNAQQILQDAMADYATTGAGMVRLFIPMGLLEGQQGGALSIPGGLTLQEALELVHIEKVAPLAGGTARLATTMDEGAFVTWTEEVQQGGGSSSVTRTELQYTQRVQKKRQTVLRGWAGTQDLGTLTLDLDGQLMMRQVRGKGIVTPQIMQLQKGLNFAMTAMGNNNANAGFLERIIANAQTPGTYETDKNGNRVFVPSAKYQGGPGSTVMLTGHPYTDQEGNVRGYTDPKPWFRDPSSPEAYRASLDEYRAAMYMEAKQGHLMAQGDGSISGTSRVHLRADFEVSLRDTRVAVEDMYRWLLTVLAKLAAKFTGADGKYDAFRPTVQASVNTGPMTDNERAAILEQFKEGLRSRESAMVLLGVDDPDAEFLRIRGEQPSNPVGLEDLALLGVKLLPEQVAALMRRAGLEVTPAQEAQLQADYETGQQLKATTAAARDRAMNPQDDGTPVDANGTPPGDGQPSGDSASA